MAWKLPWRREPEEKQLVLGLNDALGQLLGLATVPSAKFPAAALKLYEDSTIVATPVDWAAEAVSMIDPVIRAVDGSFFREDPILDLLRRPHTEYTGSVFMKHLAVNAMVTGEAGSVITAGVNRVQEIQPISPKDYEPMAGPNNEAESYEIRGLTMTGTYVRTRDSSGIRFQASFGREFKQLRGFSTLDNGLLRGQSPLLQASRDVQANVLGGEHNVALLNKGGRPALHFNFGKFMNEDTFNETERQLLAKFGGPASETRKIAMSAGENLTIHELGSKMQDMEFSTLQDQARMAVTNRLRFPLTLLFLEAATLDNLRMANFALYDHLALPLAGHIFDYLTDFLMPRFGRDPARERIWYDERTISALKTRQLERLKLQRELRLETLNEMRVEGLGKPEYDPAEDAKPGDVIMVPAGEVPIGSDPLSSDPFADFADPGDGDGGSGHEDEDDD